MNNLLRTLTESQAKVTFPGIDLRLLLSNVKDGRRQSQDAKLSDPFYDSLEGLLQDLRTVTPDNRDAEAFLKPVSRADVPDYLDIISNPMDLQTMLKKVKQKQYKSKREFQDDLDLIWTNCFTYNAAENHPLRQCARRLRAKAESLLKNITDRKERTDPLIPHELGHSGGLRIRINGTSGAHIVNGAVNGRGHRSPSVSSHNSQVNTSCGPTAIGVARPRQTFSRASPASRYGRQDISFSETPALVRTQEGMTLFDTIDKELELAMRTSSSGKIGAELTDKLLELAPPYDYCEGIDDGSFQPVIKTEPDSVESLDVEVGEKRKSAEQASARPRKRARFSLSSSLSPGLRQPSALPLPLSFAGADSLAHDKDGSLEPTELWWGAVQSDALLPNGLPRIRISSSRQSARVASKSASQSLPPLPPPHLLPSPLLLQLRRSKARHSDAYLKVDPDHRIEAGPSSLLSMMNSNLKTMKRVRHTHTRFAALVANNAAATGVDESIDGAAPGVDGFQTQMATASGPSVVGSVVAGSMLGEDENPEVVDDKADERPWLQRYIDAAQAQDHVSNVPEPALPGSRPSSKGEPTVKAKRIRKRKKRSRLPTGIDMGEEIVDGCVQWMGGKVLEHVGFQGTSRAALDVLAGVTKEYLYNVGRTIKFMSDKYAQTMTAEEIILHTLFESGTSKVQDLEQYITDDVRRHGARLGELEKKLVSAYRESAANEVQEDEGLFEEEEEDETGALAVGDFADLLGEDYLGLRELGIAAEFGMSSLTIPKKLLRSKKTQKAFGNASKPKEPPPPYPPPPPFLPLTYEKLDDQIGLLKSFYQARFQASFKAQSPSTKPTIPPLPGPSTSQSTESPAQDTPQTVPGTSASTPTQATQAQSEVIIPPDFELLDDLPNSSQIKIGPLGQIMRPSTASGSGKKKGKNPPSGPGQSGATSAGPSGPVADVPASAENSPKKKKGATGVGTGNGRKKKPDGGTGRTEATQSPVPPPVGFNQSPSRAGQGKAVVFPAVVVASA